MRHGSILKDRYRILSELGEGGFGLVYKAQDESLGREVAIKIIKAGFDRDQVERFRREARSLAQLVHPNIVAVYAIEILDDERLAIVMEYLQGRTLRQLLSEGRLPEEICDQIFRQICAGVAFAHSQGIIHRDLSTNNIFITQSNATGASMMEAKIIDFGLSKISGSRHSTLTKTGMLLGNPRYMSPEACQGLPVTASADIYSLACILYEMLSGKEIFEGAESIGLIYKQANEYPGEPEFHFANQDLQERYKQILCLCLQKDRGKRPPSADKILLHLDNGFELSSLLDDAEIWQKRTKMKSQSLLRASLLLAVIIVLAAVLFGLAFRSQRQAVPKVSLSKQKNENIAAVDDLKYQEDLRRLSDMEAGKRVLRFSKDEIFQFLAPYRQEPGKGVEICRRLISILEKRKSADKETLFICAGFLAEFQDLDGHGEVALQTCKRWLVLVPPNDYLSRNRLLSQYCLTSIKMQQYKQAYEKAKDLVALTKDAVASDSYLVGDHIDALIILHQSAERLGFISEAGEALLTAEAAGEERWNLEQAAPLPPDGDSRMNHISSPVSSYFDILLKRIDFLKRQGDFSKAEKCCKKLLSALQQCSEHEWTHGEKVSRGLYWKSRANRAYASLLEAMGDNKKALEQWKLALANIERQPESSYRNYELAESEKSLQTILNRLSTHKSPDKFSEARAYAILGHCYFLEKKFKLAKTEFQKAFAALKQSGKAEDKELSSYRKEFESIVQN